MARTHNCSVEPYVGFGQTRIADLTETAIQQAEPGKLKGMKRYITKARGYSEASIGILLGLIDERLAVEKPEPVATAKGAF